MDIKETDNGLAYDFGVAIAQGASNALAVMATKVITITGSIYALIDAGKKSDEMLRSNQLAMGGYANFLKSVDHFSEKVISGKSYFDVDNLMEGAKELSHAGLDFKKNFSLINEAAQAVGSDFAQMSATIRNGDYSSLAQAGLITDRMAKNMERTTFTQQQGTQRVLSLLQQAERKGLFKQNVATLEQTINRITEMYNSFMRSVIGDIKDPEGFWFVLRKTIASFADFFAERMDKIRKIGELVGKVLTWVVRMVGDFVKYMYKFIQSIIGNTDSFFSNWQEKMLSFGLWLEILRVKIKDFFLDYQNVIFATLKALIAYKMFKFGSSLWTVALDAAKNYFGGVNFGIKRLKVQFLQLTKNFNNAYNSSHRMGEIWKNTNILSVIRNIGVASWNWATAMTAAGLPLYAVAAIIVAVVAAVYLLWKYWNDIRGYVNGVSDTVLLMVGIVMPIVGLIAIMAKYWNEIKTIGMNFWQTLVNIFDMVVSIGKMVKDWIWGKFKGFFNWFKGIIAKMDNWMTSTFGNAWTSFKKIFFDPIKKAFNWIKDLISNVFDFSLGDGFNAIIEWTKGLADGTKEVADSLAKKAGRESFAKGGTTLQDTQKAEIKKLIQQGKTDAEIIKTMDNGNFDTGMVATTRKELEAKAPIKKVPEKPRPTGAASNTGFSQNNTYHINVSKEVDVNKVTKAVNHANNQKKSTDNRRSGS